MSQASRSVKPKSDPVELAQEGVAWPSLRISQALACKNRLGLFVKGATSHFDQIGWRARFLQESVEVQLGELSIRCRESPCDPVPESSIDDRSIQ